ncbi:type I-E CRISPR-associated protein Cas7/Cse4/CasC [Acidomonas methanolica]|nr:type I-E CRISPR-associated protein Cas7/Cse4/CasC [Acidomonas methanolica]TCS21565.1 CRISPR system Cascade subunit CasC [Acidomonas methanolica]GBQ45841.1 CRISPR-associated protein Cse4 [Acidomonas methanolica]
MQRDTLFLQIHTLTAYGASLLNRDDVGLAKRMPYGGVGRLRVSSQCQKRHWRDVASTWSLQALSDPATGESVPGTVRSRKIISREIALPLVAEGFAPDEVIAVLLALRAEMLGESKKAKVEKEKGAKTKGAEPAVSIEKRIEDALDTNQVIVLGRPEIDFTRDTARKLLAAKPNDIDAAVKAHLKQKETLGNLRALRLACGLDAALFGRMVTSDILARGDGAVHVAHALTVHKEEAESDYFVAIDNLTREAGELGTGLIQTAELTSGLFYGYVVVDVPQLVSNLEGVPAKDWRRANCTLAASAIEHLIHLIATTSPGAKLGSTAPYGYADLVMIEAGKRQPRSLMTAFHQPVDEKAARPNAVEALARHLGSFDQMYGREEDRRIASLLDVAAIPAEGEPGGLAGLARWAASQIGSAPDAARAA